MYNLFIWAHFSFQNRILGLQLEYYASFCCLATMYISNNQVNINNLVALEALVYSEHIHNHWYSYPSKHAASFIYPTHKWNEVKMEIFVAMSTQSCLQILIPSNLVLIKQGQ